MFFFTKANKFERPLAGYYRPVEGAFSVFSALAISKPLTRFLRWGGRLHSCDTKGVLQLAYGGERGI